MRAVVFAWSSAVRLWWCTRRTIRRRVERPASGAHITVEGALRFGREGLLLTETDATMVKVVCTWVAAACVSRSPFALRVGCERGRRSATHTTFDREVPG